MYEYENSPLSHELFKIELINVYHVNLFEVNVICKNSTTKVLESSFFLGNPNREWTYL
jgi:hypothetical protein